MIGLHGDYLKMNRRPDTSINPTPPHRLNSYSLVVKHRWLVAGYGFVLSYFPGNSNLRPVLFVLGATLESELAAGD
jgi:hypothetical protein